MRGQKRQKTLESSGGKVIRFSHEEVLDDVDSIAMAIAKRVGLEPTCRGKRFACDQPPHPAFGHLLPHGGEGASSGACSMEMRNKNGIARFAVQNHLFIAAHVAESRPSPKLNGTPPSESRLSAFGAGGFRRRSEGSPTDGKAAHGFCGTTWWEGATRNTGGTVSSGPHRVCVHDRRAAPAIEQLLNRGT